MHLLVLDSLMLVILTCSVGVLIEFATRPLRTPFSEEVDPGFNHQFPFSRLIHTADFDYLRRAGFSSARVNKFRERRRSTARLWLRTLAADFNRVDHAVMVLLVGAQVDRPDLASVVARQRVIFCCHFLRAEVHLALDACGFCSLRSLESLEALEALCTRMRTFATAVQPGCSAA